MPHLLPGILEEVLVSISLEFTCEQIAGTIKRIQNVNAIYFFFLKNCIRLSTKLWRLLGVNLKNIKIVKILKFRARD